MASYQGKLVLIILSNEKPNPFATRSRPVLQLSQFSKKRNIPTVLFVFVSFLLLLFLFWVKFSQKVCHVFSSSDFKNIFFLLYKGLFSHVEKNCYPIVVSLICFNRGLFGQVRCCPLLVKIENPTAFSSICVKKRLLKTNSFFTL